ncbi:thioredoxin-domain-containing protein [Lentithecium fluviatile CBS 122367]|uniref:Thioredoxin-domain-containing protein n=1 Tax=Lentithecium fluviatile CBS 122367 TaxID=1168545 RepID=A0A6G1J0J8_9PLEO|nr:thioredoxin-domain-containing protein [Lentithecium fluviatile CBS 122367]
MAKYVAVNSVGDLDSLLSKHEYTIIDFWATWCPPCKAIAPVFEKLASEHATSGKIAFAKVDVDAQPQVAKRYQISAMPTFLLLQRSEVKKAVRGANAAAIKSLITYARKKNDGQEVSEEEEKAYSQLEFGGGGGGGYRTHGGTVKST